MAKKIISKGVDISAHNTINWRGIKKEEINFVLIRAGFGRGTIDKKFVENIEYAARSGLDIGIYWFSYAANVEMAIEEAKACLRIISPYRRYINYPIFFDWEEDSNNYVKRTYSVSPTQSVVSDMAEAFAETVISSGYHAGIYGNPNYLHYYFNDKVKNTYDIWLAHVKDEKGNPLPHSTYQGKYVIHQYSWVGKPNGFVTYVDMNYCYKDYKAETPKVKNTYQVPEGIDFLTDTSRNVITTYNYNKHGKTKLSNHFSVREFACKKYTNKIKIHNKLIIILEALYKELDCSKIIVNSGYRSVDADKAVGGDGRGYHTMGRAADVVCYDQKGKIIPAQKVCCTLEDMGGIFGIGYISPTATHVDTRPENKKWWGDETKNNGTGITNVGYQSFHDYFGI